MFNLNDSHIKTNKIPVPIININQQKVESSNNTQNQNKEKKIRDPFTAQEDENLKRLVDIYGTKQWRLISTFINGRSPKQCRDRYTNYLIPGFFRGEWSKEEDMLVMQLYTIHGPKWSIIKKYLPNRSSNSIKNRWTYFLCRHYNENECNQLIQSNNSIEFNNNLVVSSQNVVEEFENQNDRNPTNLLINISVPNQNDDVMPSQFGKELALIQPELNYMDSFENNLVENAFEWFI